MSIRFLAMPTQTAAAYWNGGDDAYGMKPERKISDGDGVPCRHCLRLVGAGDPYLILGAERVWSFDEIRRHYRKLVVENHPDRKIAAGLPAECVSIATERLAAINRAFARIEAELRPRPVAQM